MASKPTTETLVLKRAVLDQMTSLLARTTRFRLATIIDLAREIKDADDFRDWSRQLDTYNPDTRFNIREIGMNLVLTLENLTIC